MDEKVGSSATRSMKEENEPAWRDEFPSVELSALGAQERGAKDQGSARDPADVKLMYECLRMMMATKFTYPDVRHEEIDQQHPSHSGGPPSLSRHSSATPYQAVHADPDGLGGLP